MDGELCERLVAVVRRIPVGRVATYGQIAALAGLPRHARHVGRALRELPPGSRVPWHRVVNAAGRISNRSGGRAGRDCEGEQVRRLLAEGVDFLPNGRIDLAACQWRPRRRPASGKRP